MTNSGTEPNPGNTDNGAPRASINKFSFWLLVYLATIGVFLLLAHVCFFYGYHSLSGAVASGPDDQANQVAQMVRGMQSRMMTAQLATGLFAILGMVLPLFLTQTEIRTGDDKAKIAAVAALISLSTFINTQAGLARYCSHLKVAQSELATALDIYESKRKLHEGLPKASFEKAAVDELNALLKAKDNARKEADLAQLFSP